jgi:phytanoyl-CoA hydroxylase
MSALTAEQRQHWEDNGFLVLKGFMEPKRTDALTAYLDLAWNQRQIIGQDIAIDVRLNGDCRRIYFDGALAEDRAHPYKLIDLYRASQEVRDVSLEPTLAEIVADLLDGRPLVCNTLIFERGSGQPDHCDTFYMPPIVPNKMCASWVALETPLPGTGQLRYYPGSHKIPPYMWSHGQIGAIDAEYSSFNAYIRPELERRGIQPTIFQPTKGDVFIWHAQLLHGGSSIQDFSNTRKSLVTHYFRQVDYPEDADDIGGERYCMTKPRPKAETNTTTVASAPSVGQTSALELQLKEAQAKIHAMEKSRSWRMTAPLRSALRTLRDIAR